MGWIKTKEWIMKARYIIGGLILERIPQELEQTAFYTNITNGTFQSGLTNGIFLAIRVIGVCTFAYGIAYYAEKTAIEKNKGRDR